MNRTTRIVTLAAAATLLIALGTPSLLPAQPMANANYQYRVMPADRLVEEPGPAPAAYEAALNRMAEDDWELVAVSPDNAWVFRRPIVN
ncbi:MAG: hypothetical protein AAGK09_06470 [Planctomycetota bacterium]